METLRSRLRLDESAITLVRWTAIGVLLLPFFKTLVLGLIFYFAFREMTARTASLKLPARAALATTAILLGFVCLVAFGKLIGFISEDIAKLQDPSWVQHVRSVASEKLEPLWKLIRDKQVLLHSIGARPSVVKDQLAEFLTTLLGRLSAIIGYAIARSPMAFLAFALLLLTFRFLKKIDLPHRLFEMESPFGSQAASVFRCVQNASFNAVVVTGAVSVSQGIIVALGAHFASLPYWSIYFFLAMLCSFIPVVGLLPVIAIGVLHAAVHGPNDALIFLGFSLVATLIDNLVRAMLLSRSEGSVPGTIAFFAVLGSLMLFGVAGLLIGPFVIALVNELGSVRRSDQILLNDNLPNHAR